MYNKRIYVTSDSSTSIEKPCYRLTRVNIPPVKTIIVCFFYLQLLLPVILQGQDAPVSAVASIVSDQETAMVQITAINVVNIGSCNLKLLYDPAVANATAAVTGPQVGGGLSTDLSVAGVISLGWYKYPALTLPDNSVIFIITLTKIAPGTTTINWDDEIGVECDWWDGNFILLNDLPTANFYSNGSLTFLSAYAPESTLAHTTSCIGTIAEVPVTINSFATIGSFSLTLQYDPVALTYLSYINDSGFPGFAINASTPGTIIATAISILPEGISLPDGSILFTLQFNATGITSSFTWQTDNNLCQFTGPAPAYYLLNDIPHEQFYLNGSFTGISLPGEAGIISGPASGDICSGQEDVIFMIQPVSNADMYVWTLPPGATITSGANTNAVLVSFGINAESGNLTVYGLNSCGNGLSSPPFTINLIGFPDIVSQPVSPPAVYADSGIAVFNVLATGTSLEYRWQEFSGSWHDLLDTGVYSGVFTNTLTITNPAGVMDAFRYRCIITDACNHTIVTDGNATLTVIPILGVSETRVTEANILALSAIQSNSSKKIILKYSLPAYGSVVIEIVNLAGSAILLKKISAQASGQYLLETDMIKPGIYLARIIFLSQNSNTEKTVRFLINH
jgi:hypothetical protein